MTIRTVAFLCVLLAPPMAAAATSCDRLATLPISRTTLAATLSEPGDGRPAFCRVAGTITPVPGSRIGFELWLPRTGWNGKIEMFGNGGYSSKIDEPDMRAQLARGYATLGTDTGHQGGDPDVAVGHPQVIVDWGWRAVHASIEKARDIVRAFYGVPARHRYFSGCSTGGHQALTEAQRFPDDFDGIIAGDPGNNRTHLNVGFLAEFLSDHATGDNDAKLLPAAKLPMVARAAVEACHAADLARDGGLPGDDYLADPRDCAFDPATLLCRGADGPDCLTAAQVKVVRAIYAGPHDPRTGHLIENGYVPGSEAGWAMYFQDFNGRNEPARSDFWSDWVFHDPHWNWWSFDFDRDVARTDDELAGTINADDPDLAAFARHGKLIGYHGFADPVVPSLESINYRRRVAAAFPGGAEATDRFYRLFMVPGMAHCTGGAGPDVFDAQGALENWVEHGQPPARIVATKYTDASRTKVAFARPLCPYPAHAFYRSGNPRDASSFDCRTDALERPTPMPAPEYRR